MAYHCSDATREGAPHALPDIETYEARTCALCLAQGAEPCGEGCLSPKRTVRAFAHFCRPGCMPDSDPIGPFDSEAEALAAARESAGFCPHGIDSEEDQDDECDPCPHCAAPMLFAIVVDGAANGIEGADAAEKYAERARMALAEHRRQKAERDRRVPPRED